MSVVVSWADFQFMYQCVMGLSSVDGEGCILADEMGLGKTLQTIALIYTMLSKSTPKRYREP